MTVNAYREDLAYIHDMGHSDLARAAAERTVEELGRGGFHQGTVVDLGSGGGVFASEVIRAGYSVLGVDSSEAMVAIARQRSPESTFWVDSFASVDLPTCVAVAAIGEVLNYVSDERDDTEERNKLFRRIYDALVPGGFVIFDMAGPDRATSVGQHRTFMEGPDWAVLLETELNERETCSSGESSVSGKSDRCTGVTPRSIGSRLSSPRTFWSPWLPSDSKLRRLKATALSGCPWV
jgi:SAM-dependent methyltransferase